MMRQIFGLFFKDLWFSRTKVLWMILFLSLASLAAFLSLSLKSSVESYVDTQARSVLGADITIASLYPLSPERIQEIESELSPKQKSEMIEFRSMVTSTSGSLLCEIRGVDESFPLIGSLKLHSETQPLAQGAYVYPEVLSELNVKVGDSIQIGAERFLILATIDQDPGGANRIFSFSPRIYIPKSRVEKTGLLVPGSQIFYRNFYLTSEPIADERVQELKKRWENEDFFVSTPEDSLDVMKRFFGFFERTLHLLSLSVILMCLFVAFYLFQVFLRDRLPQNAVLKSLGLTTFPLLWGHLLQIVVLTAAGAVLAALLSPWLVERANVWIVKQGLDDFQWKILHEHRLMILYGVLLVAVVFVLPALKDIRRTRIQDLFGDTSEAARSAGELSVLRILPLIVAVFALAVALTSSLVFSLGVAAALLILSLLSVSLKAGFLKIVLRMKPTGLLAVAARQISKNRLSMNLSFLSLVFVGFIVQIIPHLQSSLENELKSSRLSSLPTLFAFNIPEEEVSNFVDFMKSNQAEARYVSPMIPARLLSINGEKPEEDRFRKFPVRLSYRESLLTSEKIIQGEELKNLSAQNEIAPISLEAEFAERSKIKIGDVLEFDILGIKVKGRVANLREVDWLQFHPSFFIQFPPGVIDDAPKTLISSVYMSGGRDSNELLLKTIEQFPNISVLDVRRSIDRILSIVTKMAQSLQTTSFLSILLCAVSFVSLLILSLQSRRREASILKALGTSTQSISRLFTLEYVLMAAIAGLVGLFFAAGGAWAVVHYSLELSVSLSWSAAVIVVLSLMGVSMLISSQIWRGLILKDLK